MAAFGGMQITNRGRTLQAKAQTGTQLKFTRIGIGSGQLGGQIIADLNGLIDPKMFLEIRKLQTRPAGRALVGSYLSNSSVTAGFYFRELAVFALDPDVGEVLYCYANSGSTAEYIPAGGGPDIVEKYIDVITIVQNAPNVSADIDQSLVYATHKDLETLRIEMTQHRTAAVLDHPDKSVTTAKLADKGVTQAKIGDKAVGSGQLADGAATDAVIGSRTISDAEAPTGNDGPPIKLWGWLAYMIKAITGKTSWRTLPAVTLEDANAHINAASPHSGHAVTGRKINTSGGLSGGGDLSADRSLSITDNGVTDAKIGNRTVDPNISTAFSLTGTVTQLLSWITKQLKAITGEANPFDTPAVTLKQAKLKLDELDGKAKESATLQAQLGRGVNKIETDQASPLDGTVYGRTMQNIIPPQRFEANNSAWALSGGTVQYDNTVGNYEIGSASAKVTLSSDSTSFHFSTILPVLPANKHFVVVARYKNGNLSNGLTIGISNAADNLSVETSSRINSTSFATVMRRFKTLKNTPADIIRIGPYADGGEAGQYCWLDAMAIFEISEAEYNIPRAQWDDNRYPYIDGMQSVRGAVIEHPGRNLIDVMSNMSTPTSGDIFGYTGRHSFDFTPSVANRTMYITLPVVPNEIYAMSCDMSANGEFALYSDESSPIALMSYRSTPGAATVGNRTRIRVYFRGNIAGTKVSFANPMLVMGGLDKLPPSFVAREDQRIIIDEVLRSVGPVSDQVNLARKQVTRLIGVWEPSATGTYTLDSYSGVYVPRIAIPADSSKSTLPVMVRYDGLMIRIGAPSTDGPNIVSSYNWGLGTLAFSVANADSGWSGTLTPNQNAIKALLNGWRAVGNSSTAYNSWVSILDGSAPPTNTEAYVAANKAPGWTAYATLQYQLVNPVTSTARIEGAISLHSGVNALEMREAAMLREKVTPVLDSASGVYRLNFTTLPASVFKRPAETILAIYKGTDIDRKWTILANATLAKGITRAHIPFADYDLSADYFSSYIALDRYAYSAAISAATAFYAGNLGSAVSANTQQLARETLRNDIQDWIQVVDDARLIDLRLDVNAINNAFLRKLGGYRFEKVLGVVAFTASTNNQKADIYYSPDSGGHIAYLEIEVTGNWNGINAIGRVVKTIAIASSTFGNISSQFARYTVADGKAGDYISISDVVFDTTNNRYRIRLATTNTGYANGFVVTVRGVIPSKTDPVINSLALSPVFTTDTTAFVPAKVQILSSEILEDENHRFVTDYERIKLDGIQEFANHYEHPTGDGNLHVPSTGTANNGKVLKAGSTPGSASWQQIAANEISQDASNRLVTDAEKSTWNGKASTAVATTVFDGLMSSSDKQLSNNRNGYGTTAGTGTAYTLTLSPVPTLVEGLRVTVKFHTANGANPTLNVNSNSNRSILKPNGSAPAAGQLKANSVYTLVYNGTDFILQGDGGDYSIGEQILATSLQIVDYTGAELWSKTDVANGCGITVDGAGNVYCAHVVSGKSIRKLDSSGAEIWSKTDVSTGYDVAVDSAGNVYCAHAVGTGSKSIRKLDSSGAEIWSKTDISGGSGVVVDNAGNVYCAHYVGSEIKSIRKLNSSGAEIWSKTDMPFANRVALDNAGNVYGAFATSAGNKSIRKLNSSGSEIWSKTDVSNGNDVTVDSAGNVYCAHSASGGSKSIRKLDSSGAEIWSKTDVSNGYGVTLDSAGNVYCAHYTSGDKSIRKLDSSGAEIWSKTDVMYGRDVAVDSAGNVYCAHDVNSGSKSIRKLREAVLSYKILN